MIDRVRPRVALVIASLGGGGAERAAAELASYWADRSVHVDFVTLDPVETADAYTLHPGVARAVVGQDPAAPGIVAALLRTGGTLLRLRSLLRKLRPDVVLSFVDVTNILTILATRGLAVPVAVAERTHPGANFMLPRHWALLRRYIYRKADLVLAQTREAADWLARECRVRPHVIPNALRELPELAGSREPLIVCVGRLSPEKGFDIALRAFARVAPRRPGWRLVLLGEGPERPALQALSAELGIGNIVTFPGRVTDVESWLARAAVVVQPSRFEGFPNAVLEAMGMGAAVVSTACPAGPAELIRSGENGVLVPIDDVAELAAALDRLIGDERLRSAMGRAAMAVRRTHAATTVLKEWDRAVLGLAAPPSKKEQQPSVTGM